MYIDHIEIVTITGSYIHGSKWNHNLNRFTCILDQNGTITELESRYVDQNGTIKETRSHIYVNHSKALAELGSHMCWSRWNHNRTRILYILINMELSQNQVLIYVYQDGIMA